MQDLRLATFIACMHACAKGLHGQGGNVLIGPSPALRILTEVITAILERILQYSMSSKEDLLRLTLG